MVEEQSGVMLEAAVPEGENFDVASTSQSEANEQMVPLSALQAERQARQQLQEEIRDIKDNLTLLKRAQQPEKRQEAIEEVLDDDDVLTVRQLKKILKPAQASMAEMHMYRKYPDYEQVITEHLPEVLEKQPNLRNVLQQTQDYELAYYLAKNSDGCRAKHSSEQPKPKINPEAQRAIENLDKPGSLSSVARTSTASQIKKWSHMSDDEFRKHAMRNLG